jgi:hypothetical protein
MLFAVFKRCDDVRDLEDMDNLWLVNMFGKERVVGLWWFRGKVVDLYLKELKKRGYRQKKIKIGLVIDNNLHIKELQAWVKKRRAYVDGNILLERWEDDF